jgi:hypothetical protein
MKQLDDKENKGGMGGEEDENTESGSKESENHLEEEKGIKEQDETNIANEVCTMMRAANDSMAGRKSKMFDWAADVDASNGVLEWYGWVAPSWYGLSLSMNRD